MKIYFIVVAGLLTFAALPVFSAPISFPECPAVGLDTSGCELLITVTAVSGNVATAFTVTTSSPDLGPFNGSDATLIGILNSSSGTLGQFFFTLAPGTGSLAFNQHGACFGSGGVSAYSPGPTAAQCLNGQYWTTDAMDYASAGLTFGNCGFNLADICPFVGGLSGGLAPGASTWFSLPGVITASQITMVTPEPASLALIGTGLSAIYFRRRRKA